jgi:hypothetical protein
MRSYRITCTLSDGRIVVMGLLWTVLAVFTAGIALIFLPFVVAKEVLNHVEIDELEPADSE